MVDQLNAFASEVTRVAREVGTDGKLGGQAQVRGVAGTWKDLTDNVNLMATNLTDQVRGIARVVTAVATGNLKLKLTVEARGEIASLAETINNMIDTLATFADQVTGVAREVGVEGRLGGQANVPGAAGTWRDLTDNVNRLAANLTTQVRAIADVSTAVTKGDLSRSITVEAAGEVALLKDNVNEMIRNLKGTTTKNTEQDWLKSNLATFTRKLQGQRDLQQVCKMTLSELAPLVGAQHGVFYINDPQQDEALLKLLASYAYRERKNLANQFKPGEGLIGQCIIEKERILLTKVPGDYVKIGSGLGEGTPANVVDQESILKLIGNGDVIIPAVATGAEALKALADEHFDCMVLDLVLPDMSGFQVLEEMKKQPALCQVPVVVYTAKELSRKEETQLRQMAETIIIKGVHSQERLLDETALFLHRVTAHLPEAKRQILNRLHSGDTLLEGKTVLIVDDDVRNLFALTTVLEAHRMRLTTAENGQDALKLLEQMPDCNVVLMDIMMPEMDGYETMRAIRKQAKFKSLPILALTAKAMKGDREKCLAAGANDYIAKPVEPEQLLSLLRLWLHR